LPGPHAGDEKGHVGRLLGLGRCESGRGTTSNRRGKGWFKRGFALFIGKAGLFPLVNSGRRFHRRSNSTISAPRPPDLGRGRESQRRDFELCLQTPTPALGGTASHLICITNSSAADALRRESRSYEKGGNRSAQPASPMLFFPSGSTDQERSDLVSFLEKLTGDDVSTRQIAPAGAGVRGEAFRTSEKNREVRTW